METKLSRDDPIEIFGNWLAEARAAPIPLVEAVCLATSTPDGAPSARMVLFKGVDEGRFAFFTDYRSRKATELDSNPRASMVFYWHALGRQIRIEGTVERLPAEVSDHYFLTRARGSRLSAWASTQSAEIEHRERLERRRDELAERFRDREVTRPRHWGGFAIRPTTIEFWRDREDRLHDRIVFRRAGERWQRVRLQP